MLRVNINSGNISHMLNGSFSGLTSNPWKIVLLDFSGRVISSIKTINLSSFYGDSEITFKNNIDVVWNNLFGRLKYIVVYRDVAPATPDGGVLVELMLDDETELYDDSFTVILTSSVLSFSGNLI